MPPDPNVEVGVAAIVRNAEGLYLTQRRANPSADGYDKISVPGGWLDFGETPEQAAMREVLEETGVVVEPTGGPAEIVPFEDDLGRWVVDIIVGCRYISGEPTVMEPDKASWCGWMDLATLTKDLDLYRPLRDLLSRSGAL